MVRYEPVRTKETPDLVVVMAFDWSKEGELLPAFEPQEMPNRGKALQRAQLLSIIHAGVIAWSRSADPTLGEFGEPSEIFRAGDVPELE